MKVKSVLWLSPNLNLYKLGLLDVLARDSKINLTVVVGEISPKGLDRLSDVDFSYTLTQIPKSRFGMSLKVGLLIKSLLITREFDWVMLPAEKKNFPLLFYLSWNLRSSEIRIFSYNHEKFKSNVLGNGLNVFLTKYFYSKLHKILFYSESAMLDAVKKKLTNMEKSGFANNTLLCNYHLDFIPPDVQQPTILFIGRLLSYKRIDLFMKYYELLLDEFPDLSAEIIGDGRDSRLLKPFLLKNKKVIWHGSVHDDKDIAQIIRRASIVFVPGRAGLAINHSFLYGRPFITLKNDYHGPEIAFLKDDENGLILLGESSLDVQRILSVLRSSNKLMSMSKSAFISGKTLTPTNWVKSIKDGLNENS